MYTVGKRNRVCVNKKCNQKNEGLRAHSEPCWRLGQVERRECGRRCGDEMRGVRQGWKRNLRK